jgi:hypothetical protein
MRLPHSTFEHVNAVGFRTVVKDDDGGPPILTLEIYTDLSGPGWSETPAGKSLIDAMDKHERGLGFGVRRVDVIPRGA